MVERWLLRGNMGIAASFGEMVKGSEKKMSCARGGLLANLRGGSGVGLGLGSGPGGVKGAAPPNGPKKGGDAGATAGGA